MLRCSGPTPTLFYLIGVPACQCGGACGVRRRSAVHGLVDPRGAPGCLPLATPRSMPSALRVRGLQPTHHGAGCAVPWQLSARSILRPLPCAMQGYSATDGRCNEAVPIHRSTSWASRPRAICTWCNAGPRTARTAACMRWACARWATCLRRPSSSCAPGSRCAYRPEGGGRLGSRGAPCCACTMSSPATRPGTCSAGAARAAAGNLRPKDSRCIPEGGWLCDRPA